MSTKPNLERIQGQSTTTAIASFYCFTKVDNPAQLREELECEGRELGLLGTILVATEGLNASVAGPSAAVDALLARLRLKPGFADLNARRTTAATPPFRRLKVRLRNEIVSFGQPSAAPDRRRGVAVSPAHWNELITREDVLLLDVRNDYEVALGSFTDAVNPQTTDFREFPRFVERALAADKARPVAMFCTGGIRCEKASAYLLEQGFSAVYQLDGGILGYLEHVAPEQSRWRGDCFVFDERVAVDHALAAADYEQCGGCRRPLDAAARQSSHYVAGICCANCFATADERKLAGRRERRRQIELAARRDEPHLGARMKQHEPE